MININNIRGAVFDLDGTLLDSMFIWSDIAVNYLKAKNIKPEKGLTEKFNEMSLRQAAEYYVEHYKCDETVEEIELGINKMVESFYFEKVIKKNNVEKLLEYLKQHGVKMCVATATDKYLVEAALKRNGIADYFSEIFTCTIVGAGKDEPVIYRKSLEFLGTNKEDTLVFEDAFYAIRTAKNDGFTVVGIKDPTEEKRIDLLKSVCDEFIDDYADFNNIFTE